MAKYKFDGPDEFMDNLQAHAPPESNFREIVDEFVDIDMLNKWFTVIIEAAVVMGGRVAVQARKEEGGPFKENMEEDGEFIMESMTHAIQSVASAVFTAGLFTGVACESGKPKQPEPKINGWEE